MQRYSVSLLFFLAIIILLIFFDKALSFSIFNFNKPLLTSEDISYANEINKSPSISIPGTDYKFYNEWHCIKSNTVNISLIEIDYGGIKKSPILNSIFEDKHVEYNIDPDVNWDTGKILTFWNNLIKGSSDICILSVFLQTTPEGDIRYIERIKTKTGVWDRGDYQFILHED
jgi:hypothetical protein